ncbi:MAG TPA: hypothetical protein VGJ92_13800 [Methanocella sp.]
MYIPLAAHKNELVVIDNMDSFSHYFCLAKKQKMTPLAIHASLPEEEEADEEEKTFFEDGAMETRDDEDDL